MYEMGSSTLYRGGAGGGSREGSSQQGAFPASYLRSTTSKSRVGSAFHVPALDMGKYLHLGTCI